MNQYEQQVTLLLEVLPIVARQEVFALKGGTAINLFHRDMPRLSVDIDLCYVKVNERAQAFGEIHSALKAISEDLKKIGIKTFPNLPITKFNEAKIFAEFNGARIKIEPNYIIRGAAFPIEERSLCRKASDRFERDVDINCLSFEDLYGGKICAALDRQHPRDLFDLKTLLENEGITAKVKDAVIFYLLSHGRPIHELLSPKRKDVVEIYKKEFVDMTEEPISLESLLLAREDLILEFRQALKAKDKQFILGFSKCAPDWNDFSVPKAKDFPAIKWKLQHQRKLKREDPEKFEDFLKKVEAAFL